LRISSHGHEPVSPHSASFNHHSPPPITYTSLDDYEFPPRRKTESPALSSRVYSGTASELSYSPTVSQSSRSQLSAPASPVGRSLHNCFGPTRNTKSHARRQPANHIPRPKNAFILFRSWFVKKGILEGEEVRHFSFFSRTFLDEMKREAYHIIHFFPAYTE